MQSHNPFGRGGQRVNPFAPPDAALRDDLGRFRDALRDEALAEMPPTILTAKVQRRYAHINGLRRETLNELIPELPEPGVDLYVVTNGGGVARRGGVFDLGAFVPHVAERLGTPVEVFISTWAINRRTADVLGRALRSGEIARLVMLLDRSLAARDAETAKLLYDACVETGRGRFVVFRNHAKIIAVRSLETERVAVITGSANISSEPRVEQFVMTTSPEVFAFFREGLFAWALARAGVDDGA